MRHFRFAIGLLLAFVGLLIAAAGAAAAFWLVGPDNTVEADEQQLASKGIALATSPALLDRNGPTLHVTAHSADPKQSVFVGVGRDLDVASYLKNIQHTKLVQVQFPVELTTQEVKGLTGPLTAPNSLDWWVAKANGAGEQTIAWPIADGPYDLVIMNADGKTAPKVQVSFGIELDGAFLTCLLVLGLGLVLLAGGIFLMLFRRRPPAPAQILQRPDETVAQAGSHSELRMSAGALVGAVLLVASGCAAIPQQDTAQTLTRPAISLESAQSTLKHYTDVNNSANRRRDDKLIATVEAGSLLRQSRAGYRIGRSLDKAGKSVTKPFSYPKPTIAVPEYGGYPMRFISTGAISGGTDYHHLGVWERAAAGSPWLRSYGLSPKATTKLPDLGGVRVLQAPDVAKLAATPQAAATDLAQYLTVGAKSPKAGKFAASTDVTAVLADLAKAKAQHSDPKVYRKVSDTFAVDGAPTAFALASGEALVFVTLTDDYLIEVAPNINIQWATGGPTAFSNKVKYNNALTTRTLYQVALAVPVKSGGKTRILDLDSQMVDAGGY